MPRPLGGLGPRGSRWSACGPFSPSTTRNATRCPSEITPPRHDGRAVHEDLRTAAVGRDEAVPLARLVPGDGAEHAQRRVGGLVARDPDAACLRAAVPLADLELDHLPLAEQLHRVVADDLGRMHEQVLCLLPEGEEAEPPLGVEPADGSLGHG